MLLFVQWISLEQQWMMPAFIVAPFWYWLHKITNDELDINLQEKEVDHDWWELGLAPALPRNWYLIIGQSINQTIPQVILICMLIIAHDWSGIEIGSGIWKNQASNASH